MDQWQKTMAVFEDYERRFAEAHVARLSYDFTPDAGETRAAAWRMLGVREEQIPAITGVTPLETNCFSGYDAVTIRYESFERCYGAAELYRPKSSRPCPLVFVFPGHGVKGRKTESYRKMCHRLAESGAMVICPDGMGQGDREEMGHRTVFGLFKSGLTMQGLMVLEALALIRHFSRDPAVDPTRVAACGNSGGGTLCVFLAALCPELASLAATGYPSDFSYILAKERRHCACNLLPGCAHGPEIWALLSAFAPRPLFIEQGENDHLIPYDLFMRTARKVEYAYRAGGAAGAFRAEATKEGHSWADSDIALIADFLCRSLGFSLAPDSEPPAFGGEVKLPRDFASTTEVAEALSGEEIDGGVALASVFPPRFGGELLDAGEIIPDIGRGDVMQVFAQMECALKKGD